MTSPQSIRDRLRNLARDRRLDFQLALTTYGIERTLHRLGLTARAGDFILEGAQLLRQYLPEDAYRASRDGDLLARGSHDLQNLRATIEEAAALDLPDGLSYDLATLTLEEIREWNQYTGARAKIRATLAGARIPIQLDIAFGDATVPPPTTLQFRTLLDQPPPTLRGYAIETVIAEKLEAITSLGLINSRLKDYFDLWFVAQHMAVDEARLQAALRATFEHWAIATAYGRRKAGYKAFASSRPARPERGGIYSPVPYGGAERIRTSELLNAMLDGVSRLRQPYFAECVRGGVDRISAAPKTSRGWPKSGSSGEVDTTVTQHSPPAPASALWPLDNPMRAWPHASAIQQTPRAVPDGTRPTGRS